MVRGRQRASEVLPGCQVLGTAVHKLRTWRALPFGPALGRDLRSGCLSSAFVQLGGRVKDGFRSRVESVLIQEGELFSLFFSVFSLLFASSRTSFISRSDMAMA